MCPFQKHRGEPEQDTGRSDVPGVPCLGVFQRNAEIIEKTHLTHINALAYRAVAGGKLGTGRIPARRCFCGSEPPTKFRSQFFINDSPRRNDGLCPFAAPLRSRELHA